MADRTDIDALLIGALYGELTPADEARLTAHLESHPADRTALHDLTRTRAAVRDSRILSFQREPPQAISALLLQEASRRAPRARTDRGEGATWFQRFVQSFMAHPAMAAAATLVLVVAAAGSFYLRGTDQFARSEAPVTATASSAETAPAAARPLPRAPEPEAPGAGAAAGAPAAAPAGPSDGLATGSSGDPSRPAQLDSATGTYEGTVARGKTAQRQAAVASEQAGAQGALDRLDSYAKTKSAGKGAVQDAELRKLRATSDAAPAKPDRSAPAPKAVRGIELRTTQLQPRDLKDSDDDKPASGRDSRNAGAPRGGAPAASAAAPPPPPPAPGPANAAADFGVAQAQQAPASNEAKRAPAKPSANQLPPPSAASAQGDRRLDGTSNAANNANSANNDAKQTQGDRSLLEWARKQREQVIAYVNANRCLDAASTAVEIYNRAPDYYNANVATDRQIKPCLAYVNDQRDRADRARANKNAADVQAPARK
jgi:hypothetical protein